MQTVNTRWIIVAALGLVLSMVGAGMAAEPVTLENVTPPEANRSDEALADSYSLEKAANFLDSAALDWQKSRQCFTCHTNFAYLMARPSISADAPAHGQVRAFAEKLVGERWETDGPRWDAEVVAAATVLAFNDSATTGKLHPLTRKALDKMWELQREDGGWNWLKCDWPPMESDDDYGVPFAALGVGVAPEGYAQTPVAQAGLAKIKAYLAKNPPPTLHHRALWVWAGSYLPDLITKAEREQCRSDLLALQHADGGWGIASLGDWKRGDGSPQDTETSDGYGTGFVVYILRQSGVPASDARLVRGVEWLKGHQRASGRWYTRSLHADSKHFITHAGTAFAVMALAACQDQPGTR